MSVFHWSTSSDLFLYIVIDRSAYKKLHQMQFLWQNFFSIKSPIEIQLGQIILWIIHLNKSPSLQKFSFVKLDFNEKLNIVFCGCENTFETFKMIVLIISFLIKFSLFYFCVTLMKFKISFKIWQFFREMKQNIMVMVEQNISVFFFIYLLFIFKSNQSSLVLETWHVPIIQINVQKRQKWTNKILI